MMETNDCPICLEPLINSEQDVGTCVPCGHCFHELCFEEWKSSRKHWLLRRDVVPCPICNDKTKSFVKIFIKSTLEEEEIDENNINGVPPSTDESLRSLALLLLQDSEELSQGSETEEGCLTTLEQPGPISAVCHHVPSSENGEKPLAATVVSTNIMIYNKDAEEGVHREETKRKRDSSLVVGRDLKRYKQQYKQLYLEFSAKKQEFSAEKQAWSEQEKDLSEKTQDLEKKLKLAAEGLQQYKQDLHQILRTLKKSQKQSGDLQKDIVAMKTLEGLQQRKIVAMEGRNSKLKDTVQLQYARIQELLQSKDGNQACTARRDVDQFVSNAVPGTVIARERLIKK